MRLENELGESKEDLRRIVANCRHQYGEAVYDPEYHKGYTIPRREGFGSHPPIPEMNVPSETIPRWRRDCTICGEPEFTTKTRPSAYEPVFER